MDFQLIADSINAETPQYSKPLDKRGLKGRLAIVAQKTVAAMNATGGDADIQDDLTPAQRNEGTVLILQAIQQQQAAKTAAGQTTESTQPQTMPWKQAQALACRGSPLTITNRNKNSANASKKRLSNRALTSQGILKTQGSKPLIFDDGVLQDVWIILDRNHHASLYKSYADRAMNDSGAKFSKDALVEYFLTEYMSELVEITRPHPEQRQMLHEMIVLVQTSLGPDRAVPCQLHY
jgi:hypothetical protein